MKKLIYIEENFITPDECQKFIDLSKSNKKEMPYGDETRGGDTYLTTVEWKNQGASYHGGDVDTTAPSLDHEVVNRVNSICQNFDSNINLDYVGVVRWPIGTFMKPHVDDNNIHKPDVFAAMLYLNDNFTGGCTCFENFEIKPEIGKLIIFSNSQYLHYVSQVEGSERFVLSFWYNSLNK
tara:strand:+ start:349 stop:888 length:540 start_codon:yes stop_codon:yes gene_type:complete